MQYDNDDPRNIFYHRRRQFEKESAKEEKQPSDGGSNAQGEDSDYKRRVEQMKQLAQKYQREGEGQLVRDIVNNVIEQKAAGKLSNEQLKAFAARVMPLLNAEQKQRLQALLEQLLRL